MPNRSVNSSLKFVTVFLCFIGTIIFSVPTQAQTLILQLSNGDRITGNLVSESSNQVVISTAWAKELAIPVAEISKREVLAPAPEPAKTAEVLVPPDPPKPVPPPVPAPKPKPKIAQKKSWSGKADIGADLGFSETTRQLYYGRGKVVYAPQTPPGTIKAFSDRFKNTFDFNATYGRTDGVLSANRLEGTSKTDFDVGKKVFFYNLIGGGYDEIRRISLQYEVGPGVGYHLVTRTNLALNTEFGMNYLFQQFRGRDNNERFSLRMAEDFTWSLSQRLTLEERLEFFPSVEDIGEFRLRFETNLRYALWQNGSGQNIYLALTLLNIYDTQPARGVERNDLQIRSSIGINF
ncbi:MAG: YdiY family protein [Limisphaerales bacterium]